MLDFVLPGTVTSQFSSGKSQRTSPQTSAVSSPKPSATRILARFAANTLAFNQQDSAKQSRFAKLIPALRLKLRIIQ